MRTFFITTISLFYLIFNSSCVKDNNQSSTEIIFLHHSTGNVIWKGNENGLIKKVVDKIAGSYLADELPSLIREHNRATGSNYVIKEMFFPKAEPYGWKNYPFDYYNIWVKNAGNEKFLEEPTLEILTKEYDVIILKHCFPVSNILADDNITAIDSEKKTIANYKLQYNALKNKLQDFSETKFILFTGAVQTKNNISNEEAIRMREFVRWVKEEWDAPNDNIYLWDLYQLQTEGGLYFKDEYAVSHNDSHPNSDFASKIVKLLSSRIIDVIENNGNITDLIGKKKSSSKVK
jgi:hypothetical protein